MSTGPGIDIAVGVLRHVATSGMSSAKPQHHSPPAASVAQLECSSAATRSTGGSGATRTGRCCSVIEPSPSSPFELYPQHQAEPSSVTAQLWLLPSEMEIAPCRP